MKAKKQKGKLSSAEKKELRELEIHFRLEGGRGVDLAERIDELRAKRDGTGCVECGNFFDDNPGKLICKTCEDWLV